MKCEKCESLLGYGDKYCNICGEKVSKGAYDEDYRNTIWGKFDKWSDKIDTWTLKKITDHILFKVGIIILILLWGFFDAYTDITNIKLLESERYEIEYNKAEDEYYIVSEDAEVDLNLYIPAHAEKITVTEFMSEDEANKSDLLPSEYNGKAIKVKKGEFDYITISSVKEEKITDTVKIYVK